MENPVTVENGEKAGSIDRKTMLIMRQQSGLPERSDGRIAAGDSAIRKLWQAEGYRRTEKR